MALGLLIIYHVTISFQPWAAMIYFIQNSEPLEGLWPAMAMLNVWRIPILFMVSGMGVCFAMERRDWKQLLVDRTVRILLPFTFGFFFICPILAFIVMDYYGMGADYVPNVGHLWFLANIFLYVLMFLPLLTYLRNRPDNPVLRFLRRVFQRPGMIFAAALPLMVEAWLMDPAYFSTYVKTVHGFLLGMLCFITGFIFVSLKDVFWSAVRTVRWSALALALLLYLVRLIVFELQNVPNILTAFESMCWMLAILGHGSVYLNKPSDSLAYFSKAVYPVYIIHLPVQYAITYYLVPLALPAILKLGVLTIGTFGVSWVVYEFVIRRIKWIRPAFGMKLNSG
jgi:hypothetical protein